MTRTLVLTVDPAAPPISGAELRNWQNALALSELGPVKLVSLRPISGPTHLLDGRIEHVSLATGEGAQGPALARRRSRIEVRLTQSLLSRLTGLVEAFKPDTVLFEGIPLAPVLKYLRAIVPMLVLDMHNIESDLRAQFERRNLASRLTALLGSEAARIRSLERRAIQTVDRVWVCSETDRERLRKLVDADLTIDVIANGIPRAETIPSEPGPLPDRSDGWPVLLFVGHLDYAPNIVALRQLATRILPLIQRDFPAARLIAAGRRPEQDLLLLLTTNPAIELVADPQDLSELYGRAHLVLLPLRIGGGTRIKVLEAMAHGLPVVATPLAVEGLDFADGVEVLLADTARGLAGRVKTLCADPDRVEAHRQNARRSVMARYGPEAIARAVRNAVAPR